MFLPFEPAEVGEIHSIVTIVYNIIQVGWHPANNANQQYLEFKKDILTLQEQLETLKRNIEVVHKDEHARLAPTDQFHNIFADFRRTLEECQHFLERNSRFATQAGPMSNLQWALWAKDEAEMHRDRIAVLNLKLNLALQSLQIHSGHGIMLLVKELTALLLQKLEDVEARQADILDLLRAHTNEVQLLQSAVPPSHLRRTITIPAMLINRFVSAAAERYGPRVRIPFSQGLNEAIFYLDRATKWVERRRQSETAMEPCQPFTAPLVPRQTWPMQRRGSVQQQRSANNDLCSMAFRYTRLYRAYWLLQTLKEGREYQEASRPTMANFERQYPVLGMTVKRFVDKLEESILDAYDKLSQEMATAPVTQQPPLDQLLEAAEIDGDAWRSYCEWHPSDEDDNISRMGVHIETWHRVVLRQDKIIPEYSNASGCSLRIDLGGRDEFRLSFRDHEELFIAQQWLTGYKVVDDFERVSIIQQRANLVSGERLNAYGRVQIWASTRVPQQPQLPKQLVSSPRKSRRASIVSPSKTSLKLLTLPNFSRFSLHWPSESKVQLSTPPPAQTNTTTTIGRVTPSDFATAADSTTLDARSESSSSFDKVGGEGEDGSGSVFSVSRRRNPKIIQLDNYGNIGGILDKPDPPRLVIFLPSSSDSWQLQSQPPSQPPSMYGSRRSSTVAGGGGGQQQSDVGSLLVINVDHHVDINPYLCTCHEDDSCPSSSSSSSYCEPIRRAPAPVVDRNGVLQNFQYHLNHQAYQASPPSPPTSPVNKLSSWSPPPVTTTSRPASTTTTTRCLKVVLEAVNGAKGISARESVWPVTGTATTTRRPPGGVVNLAGAGRYQNGAGLGKPGKDVKKVTLEFGSLDERIRFVKYFKEVRDLYILWLNASRRPRFEDDGDGW
ncbi:hypothetical protein VTJ04DRAFT_9317 [Mycothermus thermophilus]|uniref:uncharacterized protein n=1 Tax=Humicola insolens TaxID=85995 RepID=UPI003742E9EB